MTTENKNYTTIGVSQDERTSLKIMCTNMNCDYEELIENMKSVWTQMVPFESIREYKDFVIKQFKAMEDVLSVDVIQDVYKEGSSNKKKWMIASRLSVNRKDGLENKVLVVLCFNKDLIKPLGEDMLVIPYKIKDEEYKGMKIKCVGRE